MFLFSSLAILFSMLYSALLLLMYPKIADFENTSFRFGVCAHTED